MSLADTPDSSREVAPGQVRRAAFITGIRAFGPATLAVAVWGMVTGVAMVKVGLTDSLAVGMTLLVYAGSAQLTALPLILAGAPLWLIFAAALVVNLRFVIFSAALHPYFRHYSWGKRVLLGFLTTDLGFVLFMPRYGEAEIKGSKEQTWFYLGVAAANWVVWTIFSIAGILLGAVIPAAWSLEFAAVLALMSIVVPMANSRPVIAAIAAAALVAWVGQALPWRLGLVVAVVAGVLTGMWAENRQLRRAAAQAGLAS